MQNHDVLFPSISLMLLQTI